MGWEEAEEAAMQEAAESDLAYAHALQAKEDQMQGVRKDATSPRGTQAVMQHALEQDANAVAQRAGLAGIGVEVPVAIPVGPPVADQGSTQSSNLALRMAERGRDTATREAGLEVKNKRLQASMVGSRVVEDGGGKRRQAYRIRCRCGDLSEWEVERSYSQILSMHEEMTRRGLKIPKMPPKHFFAGSDSAKVVEERMAALPAVLSAAADTYLMFPRYQDLIGRFFAVQPALAYYQTKRELERQHAEAEQDLQLERLTFTKKTAMRGRHLRATGSVHIGHTASQ